MHLLKKPLNPRRYQETIFAQAALHDTLVVLPTGMGKTMIAVMLAVQRLKQYPEGKILVLAPTKPLVEQHERTFREFLHIDDDSFALFTGSVRPEKRRALWARARIVFSTPQTIENDLLGSKISLKDVSLLVVDEAHRAVGDYAYVFLAKRYRQQAEYQRILALTASPGTDTETITEVCKNLHIEEIEVRSVDDPDVSPYVQEIDVEWVRVSLPKEFETVKRFLKAAFDDRVVRLRMIDGIDLKGKQVNKRELLMLQGQLQGMLAKGERDYDAMKAVSVAAEALKIYHALELLDTQGIFALERYFSGLQQQADKGQSKAVQRIMADANWKAAKVKTRGLLDSRIEHPKLEALRKTVLDSVRAQKDAKIIIFTQYRDQGSRILEALEAINVSAKVFVGQAKKRGVGMTQKEQQRILEEFRNGGFSCLVATSVAEEGLDIPKVDLVMFYEPIPSAIRTVQRRGRTGRGEKGRVVVLMTEGTSDVGYKWAAHHKEKRMYRAIEQVKREFKTSPEQKEQKTLLQQYYAEKKARAAGEKEGFKIIADYREKGSPVMKILLDTGVGLELQQLAVGDFQISERVVVEYKQAPDFVDSIVDGRLLAQLKSLRQYTRPVIIIEGEQDIYALRRIHPNAIQGMLATIAVGYNTPILWSRSPKETAGLLIALAKREQVGGQEWQYHTSKPLSDDEVQEYIIAAFPGIGSQLARPLLKEFKSIKNVVNASEEDLKKVPLIGGKKAKRIRELSEKEYGGKEENR